MVLAAYIFQQDSVTATKVRIAIILFMFFAYEPICTSKFCTLGQLFTGIRIRNVNSHKHISLSAAYLRIFMKILLGFISFFTIPFSAQKRALQDFMARSIVLENKLLKEIY